MWLPWKEPPFQTYSSFSVNSPLYFPSADSWRSKHPEIKMIDAFTSLARALNLWASRTGGNDHCQFHGLQGLAASEALLPRLHTFVSEAATGPYTVHCVMDNVCCRQL